MLQRHLWHRRAQCLPLYLAAASSLHRHHRWTLNRDLCTTHNSSHGQPIINQPDPSCRHVQHGVLENIKKAKRLSLFQNIQFWSSIALDTRVNRASVPFHSCAKNIKVTRGREFTSRFRTGKQRAHRSVTRQGSRTGTKALSVNTTDLSYSQIGNHRGVCPPTLPEWRPDRARLHTSPFPWLSRIGNDPPHNGAEPAMRRLVIEINAGDCYFSPSPHEKLVADVVFGEIKDIIHQCLGDGIVVDLIGSRAADTDSPMSDLDVNLTVFDKTSPEIASGLTKEQLRHLDNHMRKNQFRDVLLPHAFLGKAHVPIVVGTHLGSGLEFQIQSTRFAYDSLEVTKAFLAEYPTASKLFRIIKQMLLMRGLTQGVSGGLTSYPLLNMVITSLKLSNPRIANDDTASQLLFFLQFWTKFRCDKEKIVLRNVEQNYSIASGHNSVVDPISSIPVVTRKQTKSMNPPYAMCLQDPADSENDLGRNVHCIEQIQACFETALNQIQESMLRWNRYSDLSNTSAMQEPILAWCLGGNYLDLEEARWQLSRYSP